MIIVIIEKSQNIIFCHAKRCFQNRYKLKIASTQIVNAVEKKVKARNLLLAADFSVWRVALNYLVKRQVDTISFKANSSDFENIKSPTVSAIKYFVVRRNRRLLDRTGNSIRGSPYLTVRSQFYEIKYFGRKQRAVRN